MYDGTGFHVDKRQAKHDTIIQKQSCSKFAPFHKMALFAKVFLQFPEAHDVFTIQMRIRITGEGYETANKVSNQFSIPPRSQYDAEWFEVGARWSSFDIPGKFEVIIRRKLLRSFIGIETMSDEEISNLECAFFIEPNSEFKILLVHYQSTEPFPRLLHPVNFELILERTQLCSIQC